MTDILKTSVLTRLPEYDLLLHAMLAADQTSAYSPLIDDVNIEWDYLLEVAETHGLTPLLFQYLNNYHSADTPDEVLNLLNDRYKANELRNRVLTQELYRILDLLHSRGIRALAYKGPSLTLLVYGELGLRQFGDLDILICTTDVPQACELLEKQGYNRTIPTLSPAKEREFIRTDHEHEFISDDQLVHIDLHWALSTRRFPFQLEPEGLFDRAEHLAYAHGNIEHICTQDMLLLLCMHSNKDLWRKLIWVCDIDRLVRTTTDINWDSLWGQARNSHCERMLYLSLLIAHELLQTPVPGKILNNACTSEFAVLGQQALQLSLQDEIPENSYLQCLAIQPFILTLCDKRSDRIKYILRTLTTPTEVDMMRYNLPIFLHFIYYLIKPLRKLFRCTARYFKRRLLG
jgi:hypothetical protein